ncbi:MAG: ImmA/IrrE family metallo-endopeptidase [Parvularculaceae bacterium]
MPSEKMPITRSVLTWARQRAGYSLEALQAEKGFAKAGLWENEDSDVFPSYPQLEKLSEKLKVPIAVFFFPEPPEIPPVEKSFRTLGPDQVAMIPPRIRLLLGKAKAFQLSLVELTGGENPAERLITREYRPNARVSIDRMAARVREYIGVPIEEQFRWAGPDTALKAWRNALESVGVYVFKDQFRQDDYSGFCLYDDEFPIIYVNNSTTKTRQCFTLFHELAHLLFHTSGIDTVEDDYIDALPEGDQKIEIICNRFAARFLVPEDRFEKALGDRNATEETAADLASLFNVSREFIFRMFLDRGLITEKKYRAAVKLWNSQKKPSSGGDPYRSKIAYLGDGYIDLAFSQFYRNRIDEIQLADYLDIKPKNVATLESYVTRGAP